MDPDSPLVFFFTPPGTKPYRLFRKILPGTGIIRFPKYQSGISDTGVCAGRLGAEPELWPVAGPASGAHYKAGREGTRARFGHSEGWVSSSCLLVLSRLRRWALGSGSLMS